MIIITKIIKTRPINVIVPVSKLVKYIIWIFAFFPIIRFPIYIIAYSLSPFSNKKVIVYKSPIWDKVISL